MLDPATLPAMMEATPFSVFDGGIGRVHAGEDSK